jgi:RNA polymerase sigma-70 factor (ECF subfamily)
VRRTAPQSEFVSLSDEALLSHVRRGSEPHFNALYARYFTRIYGFVRLRVGDRADAEELTQEVFAAVFTSAGAFGARASALSWIYGVARNTVLNHLRRKHAQRERLDRVTPELLAAVDTANFTPEEQVRCERFAAELERRIGRLAPWQLDAFQMRHIENAPIEEISRRTSRSADAVRSGLYRAKRLLLEVMGAREGDV